MFLPSFVPVPLSANSNLFEFSSTFEIVRETTSSHHENIFGFYNVGSDACVFSCGGEDQEEHGQVGFEKLKTISLTFIYVFFIFFRVLDIVNSELCFGVPATKCKCYTQNEA